MWCVVLQPKGTTRNALLPATAISEAALPTAAGVGAILRRATPPEAIGTWAWTGLVLHLFAYKTGKAGTENKHELPPPHDTALLFGEAVILATKNNVLVSFSATDFTKFYNDANGGFEDLESEESGEEEEEEEEEEVEEEVGAEEEGEVVEEEEEEEEPVRRPAPKVSKSKRTNKKMAAWFALPELEAEQYSM